jgi:uncharacterized protein (TIGR02391 family)
MPRRTQPTRESIPPTLTPHQAIKLLGEQLAQIGEIKKMRYDDPKIKKWVLTTESILNGAFGKPDGNEHQNTSEFAHCAGGPAFMNPTSGQLQATHALRTEKRKAILESAVEQLQILAPPAAQVAPDQYRFHPEIERVSGQLFRDGHYREAALNAYIRVIEEVKTKSGVDDDGDSLMNRAFGCERQTPVIQFNNLLTEAERDEQRGFMFLFKGVVALRNSKAHSIALFDDPYAAHDYLALASL